MDKIKRWGKIKKWRVSITWWIIFCIGYSRLFWKYLKRHETVTDNPSITIYVNKIEHEITFKRKTWCYLELLIPETIELLERTKIKITKDENWENVPHLEINEVILIHCNIVKNQYQQDSRVLYRLVPNKSFGQLLDISPKKYILKKF